MKTNRFTLIAALLAIVLLSGCGAEKAAATPTAVPETQSAPESARPEFAVELLSTGKSDCAIIYMDGLVILSDTADEDDFPAIAGKLKADGVQRIDYIILSHYDKDHIGAAASLIRSFEVGTVIRPNHVEESGEYYALTKAETAAGTPVVLLRENYYIQTANGSVAVDPADMDYGDDNNNTAVTRITYRGHDLLFLGDARKKRIEELLRSGADHCDFIKLPHHGDGNKALFTLLRLSEPTWAAETVSEKESVEPELLELLDKLGVTLYLTSEGPVHILWDGAALTASQG